MFEDIVDNVLVLSLPDAADRRARLPDHLAEFGISSFEWHDAFGPDAPEVTSLFESGQVAAFPPCFRCGKTRCDCDNNVLIPPQVANFASFIEIWRKIAASPQVALILEDDVQFHPWAQRSLSYLTRKVRSGALPLSPNRPFLLRLGWPHNRDHKRRIFNRLRTRVRMANPCHIITSAFAQALLDRFDGIKTTSDVYIHREAPRVGEALTLFPPLATELSFALGQMDSSIHPKEAYLNQLTGAGQESERAAHEVRLRQHIKRLYHRPILCVGHPRSGTKFAAEYCGQLGLDVGHESDGKDGISSWMCAVDADENPWAKDDVSRTRRALRWDLMVQVVRDPADAVPSIIRENRHAPESYAFRRAHILRLTGTDLDSFETEAGRAVASLTLWNQLIRKQSPEFVFRIEQDHKALAEFLASKGFGVSAPETPDLTPVNADKQYKRVRYDKPTLAAEDWQDIGAPALELLSDYCGTYGYANPAL